MGRVFISSEDNFLRERLVEIIASCKHQTTCGTLDSFAPHFENFDVVVIDANPRAANSGLPLWFEKDDGELSHRSMIEVLSLSHTYYPAPALIFISLCETSGESRYALEHGAIDYILVPAEELPDGRLEFQFEKIKERLCKAVDYGVGLINRSHFSGMDLEGIIGKTWQLNSALSKLALAAKSNDSTLLIGEVGTGKRLFASKIHLISTRKNLEFIFIDCRSDAEIAKFGEIAERIYREQYGVGTIFLNNIDSTTIDQQALLLKNLQQLSKFLSENSGINCQIISAVFQDLKPPGSTLIEDLYYLISRIQIYLPPLRERTPDILAIATYHLEQAAKKNSSLNSRFKYSEEFTKMLMRYAWPGNIQELINVISQSLTALGNEDVLLPHHLPPEVRSTLNVRGIGYWNDNTEELLDDLIKNIKSAKPDRKSANLSDEKSKHEKIVNSSDIVRQQSTLTKQPTLSFYRNGDLWNMGVLGHEKSIRHLSGFDYILFLLQNPEKSFSAVELYRIINKLGADDVTTDRKSTIKSDGNSGDAGHSDFEYSTEYDDDLKRSDIFNQRMIDLETKGSSKKELSRAYQSLKKRLEEKDFDNEDEEVKIEQQIRMMNKYLYKKLDRDPQSSFEKARTNVTKLISRALKSLSKYTPELSSYLNPTTIVTGDNIFYRPTTEIPDWILHK